MAAKKFLIVGTALGIAGMVLLPSHQLEQISAVLAAKTGFELATQKVAPKLDRIITSAIVQPENINAATLSIALDALSADDYKSARAIRDTMAKNSLDYKALSWAMAYFGGMYLPPEDISAAQRLAADWPGADVLGVNRERALARQNLTSVQILTAFANQTPKSFEGALLLARAYKEQQKPDLAVQVLRPFWLTERVDAVNELAVIKEFGNLIAKADHQTRMQKMLLDGQIASASRLAGLAGADLLFAAWAAVINRNPKAGALLDAVPQSERLAGYIFAKSRYLRRKGQVTAAAKLMLTAPRDAGTLIDPDAWWEEQQVLARDLIDLKKFDLAYQIAANHAVGSTLKRSDAEFHAGWIALRFLKQPAKSVAHFQNIGALTGGPISQARAYYWLGRAAEASENNAADKGQSEVAAAVYKRAAVYATTYYGQLAAAKLGSSTLTIATPAPTAIDRERFFARQKVQAAKLLIDAGHAWRATPLINDLAETLASPSELTLLAEMAAAAGQSKLALQVGKTAANRGVDVGALTHPIGAIPEDVELSSAGRALAYAVARQESEFHVGAKSSAGALGLLQLMPGTAQDVATRAGIEFSKIRLSSDAGYNATLGARYLSEQIDRFDGSYILTFIAYNAGPKRAAEWVKRYGNPKGKTVEELVDFVELIPFAETRSYVQRVMENYQVYKWRLNGQYDIVADLRFGRK